MKKIKHFIPAVIWMIFIFFESSLVADASSSQSNIIVQYIYSLLSLPAAYQELLSFLVRKCAHISEYMILTFLLYYGFYKNKVHSLSFPFIIALLYACSDEIHQLFVPGRAGMIQDILIDLIGVIIALIIVHFIKQRKLKRKYDI